MDLDTDENLALLFGDVASVRAVQADMRRRWMLMLLLVRLHCGRLERAKKAEAVKTHCTVVITEAALRGIDYWVQDEIPRAPRLCDNELLFIRLLKPVTDSR